MTQNDQNPAFLGQILLRNLSQEKRIDKSNRLIKYKLIEHKGRNFEGLISYLEDTYGSDIHQQGIVNITASSNIDPSGQGKPEYVIKWDWNWNFSPKNIPDQWWKIDFNERKVKLNGYSIKTAGAGYGYGCANLMNWVIEGCNTDEIWEEIDRKVNNHDLNGYAIQHYFPIRHMSKPYQCIRLKSTGLSHNGNPIFLLTNFEIFGEIEPS